MLKESPGGSSEAEEKSQAFSQLQHVAEQGPETQLSCRSWNELLPITPFCQPLAALKHKPCLWACYSKVASKQMGECSFAEYSPVITEPKCSDKCKIHKSQTSKNKNSNNAFHSAKIQSYVKLLPAPESMEGRKGEGSILWKICMLHQHLYILLNRKLFKLICQQYS